MGAKNTKEKNPLPKRKVKTVKNSNKKTLLANVGVVSIPISTIGAGLLGGLGSSINSAISSVVGTLGAGASSLAAGVGFIPGLIGYSIYDDIVNGPKRPALVTPEQRHRMIYSSDATRVSKPTIMDSLEKVKVRPITVSTRSLSSSLEASLDSTSSVPSDTSTVSPTPSQKPEDNKNNKEKKSKKKFRLWEKSDTPNTSRLGRTLRNWGLRFPIYSGLGAPVLDFAGNIIGASQEPEDQEHIYKWPLTDRVWTIPRGIYKLIGDAYSTPTDSTEVSTNSELDTMKIIYNSSNNTINSDLIGLQW